MKWTGTTQIQYLKISEDESIWELFKFQLDEHDKSAPPPNEEIDKIMEVSDSEYI